MAEEIPCELFRMSKSELRLSRTPGAIWACGHLAEIEAAVLKNLCSDQLLAASAEQDLHCL